MQIQISVVICAHNPNFERLQQVLDALRVQTLPAVQWELLLIDNASTSPLNRQTTVAWHPQGRIVREERLGLTAARVTGIKEASGDLLIFIDDDNVAQTDYLETALNIANEHPWVGAFGGSIVPRYEKQPEPKVTSVLNQLALRQVSHPMWAMGKGTTAIFFTPFGAGMVVRRAVARDYMERCSRDPLRQELDRKGESLSSGGDLDLALCACQNGLAVGLFPDLVIEHLIPAARVEPAYLLRLTEGIAESNVLMGHLYGNPPPPSPSPPCRADRLLTWWKKLRSSAPTPEQIFLDEVEAARVRGREKGAAKVRQWLASGLRAELSADFAAPTPSS